METRARTWVLWGCAAILIPLVLEGVYASLHLGAGHQPGLGNHEETVRMLPPAADGTFRFAVMGDPEEGAGVWRHLMRKAHELGAQFVVIAGDLVDRPTREGFEFFRYQYSALGPDALPTFAAIGNHDLSAEGLFDEYIGPPEFSFVHGDSLFVFADNNLPEGLPRCGRYVRGEIERHRGRVRRVFIVVHKPLVDYRRQGGELQRYREAGGYLYQVLDSERVDAVLAAHYHGYLRERYKDTLLVVTGGAGARLHDSNAFHHMVLVDVGPDGIRDTV
ncbi:MAG: metallophosphoesterase family protein, partial [Thermoanaerobaculia bacterium]